MLKMNNIVNSFSVWKFKKTQTVQNKKKLDVCIMYIVK